MPAAVRPIVLLHKVHGMHRRERLDACAKPGEVFRRDLAFPVRHPFDAADVPELRGEHDPGCR